MRRWRAVVQICAALLLIVTSTSVAHATTAESTHIADTAPLMITSFGRVSAGTDLAFIELYNSGDSLLDLSTWELKDMTNGRTMVIAPHSGYIEPKTHVIASRAGAVTNATYTMTGWVADVAAPQKITALRLSNTNYRPHDTSISSTLSNGLGDGTWVTRSYGVSSYSSTTFEAAYRPLFDDGVYQAPNAPVGLYVVEIYPYASTCSPFDTSILCGDYVKLYNASATPIDLSEYVLRTDSSSVSRTTSNTVHLSGSIMPGEYLPVSRTDTDSRLSLTNSGGYVWIEDTWGLMQYQETLTRYESAGSTLQGFSYMFSEGAWQWTSTPDPYGQSIITPPAAASCPDGQYRNPDTNRCRTIGDALNMLATCDEGSERNLATNRCRKIPVSTSGSALTPCKEGQERNPETNRCRSIASAIAELIPCNEGYERNPATNRCRKTAVDGASTTKFPVEPYQQGSGSMAMWWAIAGVGAVAVGYGVWEWRREIAGIGATVRSWMTRRRD